MILRHLTWSAGVARYARVTNLAYAVCFPSDASDTPTSGDYAASLVYYTGTLPAGASKTINIQYLRN